jgi:dTMP kinase
MLITFEGLDCSGKSTQARILVDRLRASDLSAGNKPIPVHIIREPGGTVVSEKIRDILLDRDHTHLTEVTELLLFSASRAQLVAEIIIPLLRQGDIVVCDRFFDSTTAYQGYGRQIDLNAIADINRLATWGVTPNLTLFLDIPLDEINRRKETQGQPHDRMESSGREFYERVRTGYLKIAEAEHQRCVVVDGSGTPEHVSHVIWQIVDNYITKERGG